MLSIFSCVCWPSVCLLWRNVCLSVWYYYIVKALVTLSCPTLSEPMNYSLSSSSVHGIFQVRILECVAISSVVGSSRPRDQVCLSYICIAGRFFYHWVKTKTKQKPMEWEKMFSNDATKKRLSSKIYKQFTQLYIKKTNNPIKKLGRNFKYTFLQRRHTDGQQSHEKMLHIVN